MRAICFLSAGCLVVANPGSAAVYRVPDDVARIADALALSVDGDVITVQPGTYAPSTNGDSFPLEVLHNVTLCGSGMGVTILDAGQTASVLILKAPSPHVSGFTITGGSSTQGGGLVVWDNTGPEIDHNLILNNGVSNIGSGAFVAEGAHPNFHHNVFWGNFDLAPGSGGDPHSLQFFNAGGIVEHNVIGRGDSNGLWVNTSAVTIRNNVFFENGTPGVRGRGICAVNGAIPVIAHNLFFGNAVAALLVAPSAGNVSASQANALSPSDGIYGNLDADPAFVDASGMNWNLTAGSPAIDAGDPASAPDPDGTRADVGPFYFPQFTSGLGDDVVGARILGAPNPFTAFTTLSYRLERPARVTVNIYDAAGRAVARLVDRDLEAGLHSIRWDGQSGAGSRVPPGVYFARLHAGNRVYMSPLVLTR